MDSGFRRNDVSVNELGSNYGSVRGEHVVPYAVSLSNHTPRARRSVRGELVEPYAVSALFRAR